MSDLHVSPRGEAKWVRRPSGRGASRAKEKDACKPAFKVFYESRNTRHGFFGAWSTEALQSCFFRPGMLGMSSRRRRGTVPCGSRIRASQAFTSRKPLILRSLRNTNHETRVTAFMFFTNHESRNTTHGFVFFTNHGTRNMVSMVHVGTEALQSFFSG